MGLGWMNGWLGLGCALAADAFSVRSVWLCEYMTNLVLLALFFGAYVFVSQLVMVDVEARWCPTFSPMLGLGRPS
ncbi:uncharacterized protein THITE_2123353 [Thermothielavioides terrestris NRRL 8126]|uniref:Uncharacterized protein n=1 Tax=Thermothielavioides terrestris (strain ATCC 38088 / NRRL 8126) TaxID=578455 RepID=G2RH84_THETT|nr:uncharacterized protein THITE_2123353 [Thermothielavioides terrestris NRRL 8126]AEO71196.1 hypothetical protein THITE_2123353 [Thermothielavioides terrestris NRRL 8126]